MQISIETTTQTSSTLIASLSATSGKSAASGQQTDKAATANPVTSVLENATKKAEKDAVVIAALQKAVDQGKGETEEDSEKKALASIAEYQKTAGKLQTALGDKGIRDDASTQLLQFESASISTTTIEAEIGDQTVSAEFISIDRVSYDSRTGLSARSATAANIEATSGNSALSYQSASVSSLYAGTGEQVGNLLASSA
ncbi:hypothetical protein J0X15_10435 [Roseibium sp. CAU 1637]|uniref:Uncharacterized protein n=1 Tax=Roseibium limicola TaxID=2816037 RepID=A0A939J8T4_9HYPH|nr:hypothetical protein [Roseibium limicola]MBO0345636.1 hypothetical protein [Roseibium limicola]